MNPIIIVPARLASQRLHAKALKKIGEKPLIQHVWERAIEADIGKVYVATDHNSIAETVTGFGGNVIMTEASAPSGTDRVAEALQSIDEDPDEMFGKIMSISDDLMWRWFELLSFMPEEQISKLKDEMNIGKNPRDIKFVLAEELVDRFHKDGDGEKCKETFLNRFQKGNMPDEIELIEVKIEKDTIPLVNLLKDTNMISSISEGNRLIKQGGIKINSKKVEDSKLEISKGTEDVYQVGKRKFLKIKV